MKLFETPNGEASEGGIAHGAHNLESDVIKILKHELVPRNHFEAQLVLAAELYVRDHPKETLDVKDSDTHNTIMHYWTGQSPRVQQSIATLVLRLRCYAKNQKACFHTINPR